MIGRMTQPYQAFNCFCREAFDPSDEIRFKKHIILCKEFQKHSPITQFFNNMKLDQLTLLDLQIIRAELELKLEEVRTYAEIQESGGFENGGTKEELIPCNSCNGLKEMNEMIFLETCIHSFCKKCLVKLIVTSMKEGKEALCISCNQPINEFEKKMIIGEEEYNRLMDEISFSGFQTTTCCQCNNMFVFEAGSVQGNLKDDFGNLLTKEKEMHYANNRFKCPNCHIEQCRKCKTTPYHLGKTCEENQKHKESKLCKYCEEPIERLASGMIDVCDRPDCVIKIKDACKKVLQCGHSCSGFHGENHCLPCLHQDCSKAVAPLLNGQTGDDYCIICGVERIVNAPCIRSSCGHIFHLHCITTRIVKRWHRPRIVFNFCSCPLCKKWLEFPPESALNTKMLEYTRLFEDIKRKSMERLKYEKRDQDERLVTKGDAYYQKPVEYAIAIYSYYECFKCKKPYFGGLKRCEDLMQEDSKNESFKPEELVCAECSSVGITLQNCPKHGKDYIEFKCKFCCSIATWFCWGSTHFCESCHKRQCEGDYVSKYTKDKLPKCTGKNSCPLKVDHKGNGEEFALGCALCRNLVNSHDF